MTAKKKQLLTRKEGSGVESNLSSLLVKSAFEQVHLSSKKLSIFPQSAQIYKSKINLSKKNCQGKLARVNAVLRAHQNLGNIF